MVWDIHTGTSLATGFNIQEHAYCLCVQEQQSLRLGFVTTCCGLALATLFYLCTESSAAILLAGSSWTAAALSYFTLFIRSGHFWDWWWMWKGPIIRIANYKSDDYSKRIEILKSEHENDIFDYHYGVIKCRNNKVAVMVKLVL
jgi:hypothetical protein